MDFTAQILFLFGGIGVFNSVLISVYFLFSKKSRPITNVLFGFFLLFLSERVLKSLIYFFSDVAPNGYVTFGPVTFLLIGPFLFLYINSRLKFTPKIHKNWKLHILGWVAVAFGMHLIYPFKGDPVFWKNYILPGINLQWLGYLIASGILLFYPIKKTTLKRESLSVSNLWLLLLLIAVAVLWFIYFFIDISYFVLGSITFSILFYGFFLYFIFHKKEQKEIFQTSKRHIDQQIAGFTKTQLINKLDVLMVEQKPYINPHLKSSDIAKSLSISTHQFSLFLNASLGKSFTTYINEYRVEEAKHLIQSNNKYTLEAIGNASGFNSKSTFFTTFKRLVGSTPSKYKSQL